MISVAVLTSSRADFGIYLPLLREMRKDNTFEIKIIAFGTHKSIFHGQTIDDIKENGFEVFESLDTLILGDSEEAISNSIGNTVIKFSSVWKRHKDEIDIVLALGDRFEMFAAVTAAIPFNIKIAHLHGGEKTEGAIDDQFRHCISLMSDIHFTSTEVYSERVHHLIGRTNNVYNVGALGLDNLLNMDFLSISKIEDRYNIDMSIPTILSTIHPETVNTELNESLIDTICKALDFLSNRYQILITMPNADTYGMVIRQRLEKLINSNSKVFGFENLGSLAYFSCMKYSSFLLGNTSSGIIEAPSLKRYVINIGSRQKGRVRNKNVFDVDIDFGEIISKVNEIEVSEEYSGNNIYQGAHMSSKAIMRIIKMMYN